MALIEFGPFVVGARGTIGGVTYSQNGSGPYAKSWARSSVPRSTAQQDERLQVATAANQWQTMTVAQRIAWDTFAFSIAPAEINPFGGPYRISGYAWFSRSTIFRAYAGLVPLIVAPVVYNVNVPSTNSFFLFASTSAFNSLINYVVGTYTATKFLFIKIKQYNTVGRANSGVHAERLFIDTTPPATQRLFQVELDAKFGNVYVGQSAQCEIFVMDPAGYLSAPLTITQPYIP